MNREDIIRMAREAGLSVKPPSWGYTEHYHFAGFEQAFERFAALVAAAEGDRIAGEAKHIIKRAEARGAAAEREACAKVVEDYCGAWDDKGYTLAAAIRARGQA